MACYRQIKRQMEEGTGWLTCELIVADSYKNLFTQTGVVDIDILRFSSSKKDLEKNGSQKEDEFSFEMSDDMIDTDDSVILTANNQAARDFILTAETSKIWIALFVFETEVYTPGAIAQLEFSGMIRNKISGSNTVSFGNQWGSVPNPNRDWKLSAASLGDAVMSGVNMSDKTVDGVLVKGILTEMEEDITGVGWIYISKPISYKLLTPGGFLASDERLNNMVNLNHGLNQLRRLTELRVKNDIPEFELSFKSSQSGFNFVPSLADTGVSGEWGQFKGWENNPTDKKRLTLLDISATTNVPMVSINLFISGYGIEDANLLKQQKELEKPYTFANYDNFSSLIYALAPVFGCYCVFRNLTATHLEIEFVPYQSTIKDRVYLCDYISGDLDLQTEKITQKRFKGKANYAAVEGDDTYKVNIFSNGNGVVISKSDKFDDSVKEEGDLIPLTISPTMVTSTQKLPNRTIPHNMYRASVINTIADGPHFIHTAIYIHHRPTGYTYDIVTPAIQVVTSIDGEDYVSETMAGLLNALDARNGQIHEIEYKRRIQWISRFSLSSAGTAQSWKNLKIGSEYVEDGRSYCIAGIERDYDNFETQLRLTKVSKYGFTEPVGAIGSIVHQGFEQFEGVEFGIAGDTIYQGDAVIEGADGKMYRMLARSVHYGKFTGIALRSADIDEQVITSKGIVYCDFYSFTAGQLLYVRNGEGCNLSHNGLLYKTADEDLSVCVGRAKSANEIEVDVKFESIAKQLTINN